MEYVVPLQIFFIFSIEFAITTEKSREKKPIKKKKVEKKFGSANLMINGVWPNSYT